MTTKVRVGDVYVGAGHRFPTFEVDSFFKSSVSGDTRVLVRYTAKKTETAMEVLDLDFILNHCTLKRRRVSK